MTSNQIAYNALLENTRHNYATEGETLRHNQATEGEVYRHNVATESLTRDNLLEVQRHNQISESIDRARINASIYATKAQMANVRRQTQTQRDIAAANNLTSLANNIYSGQVQKENAKLTGGMNLASNILGSFIKVVPSLM